MKLWQKDTNSHSTIHAFTAGKDRAMDAYLAGHDVIGSLAHIQMLNRIGLLTDAELTSLQESLRKIPQPQRSGVVGYPLIPARRTRTVGQQDGYILCVVAKTK